MSKKLFVLTMAVVLVAIACSKTSGGPSDPTPVIAATPAPTPTSTPKPGAPNSETVAPTAITVMAGGQAVIAAEIYREVVGEAPKLVQVSDGDGKVFVNGLNDTDVIRIVAPGYLMSRRMVSQMDPGSTYTLRSDLRSPGLICRLFGNGKIATILPMDRVSVSVVGADASQVANISKYIEEFAAVTGIDIAMRQAISGETALTVTVTENVAGGSDLDGFGKPDIVQAGRTMTAHVDIKSAGLLYGRGGLHHELMHALFGFVDLYPYGVGGDTSIMGRTNVEQTLTDWDLAVLAQIRSRPPGTMWEDTLPGVASTGATCN